MHGQRLPHKEDAVHVVGHHLNSLHLYLREIAADAQPFALHSTAQCRQLYPRLSGAAALGERITHEMAEHGVPPFHFQRDHVHASLRIVVIVITAFHRSLFLAGKYLFRFQLFLCQDRYSYIIIPSQYSLVPSQ